MTMTTTETVASSLADRKATFVRSYCEGDAAAMAALYTADAQLLPPGSDVVTGPPAIAEYWAAVMAWAPTVGLEVTELQVAGELAITVGTYVLSDRQRREVDNGKFLVVWRLEAGAWRTLRDIWNSNVDAWGGDRS